VRAEVWKFFFLGVLVGLVCLAFYGGVKLAGDDPPSKVAVTNPADSPSTVYVLQSFYDDLTFVDGVFSSKAEAEKWIEDTHGSFERSGRDGIDTYEAGEFTYLITAYEVDDHG
jgi:hypothetical protein